MEGGRTLLDCLHDGLGQTSLVNADVAGVEEDLGDAESIIRHLDHLLVIAICTLLFIIAHESLLYGAVIRQDILLEHASGTPSLAEGHVTGEVLRYKTSCFFDVVH